MAAEGAEAVDRNRPFRVERRHDGGEDFAEHRWIVTRSRVRYGFGGDHRAEENTMLREFKDFLMKGNIVDLAVAS